MLRENQVNYIKSMPKNEGIYVRNKNRQKCMENFFETSEINKSKKN